MTVRNSSSEPLFSFSLSFCLCLSVCLSICLSVCLPVCLSACLPVCLSACLPISCTVYCSPLLLGIGKHLVTNSNLSIALPLIKLATLSTTIFLHSLQCVQSSTEDMNSHSRSANVLGSQPAIAKERTNRFRATPFNPPVNVPLTGLDQTQLHKLCS